MPHQYSAAFVARFWSRVDRSGDCWVWTGARSAAGYGQIRLNDELLYAHHVAWVLAGGSRANGVRVLHTCDHPPCLRNDDEGTYEVGGLLLPRWGHLFGGTQTNNMRDAVAKRRMHYGDAHGSKTHPDSTPHGDEHYSRTKPDLVPRGEQKWSHKVTEAEVREIRRLRASGVPLAALAERFSVWPSAISKIANRRSWRHVV